MQTKWTFFVCLFILAIPQFMYRFNHTEMTETQLLLHFFDAYIEIFNTKQR